MATRFYLPWTTGPTAEAAPAYGSGWGVVPTGAGRGKTSTTKANTALTTETAANFAETSTSVVNVLHRQYVSDPLAAQTISGTFSAVVRALESATAANANLQVILRVVSFDGTVERGVLYAGHTAANTATVNVLGQEFPTTLGTRIIPSGTALSSVSAQANDRLVLELGARHDNTSATSYNTTFNLGDPTATADFSLVSGTTTAGDPWIELSGNLTFATAPTAYNLFSEGATLVADADSASVSLGTEFYVTQAGCVLTQIRYPQPASGTQDLSARQCAIYSTTNGTSGTLVAGPFTMPVPTAGNWIVFNLPDPIVLTANTRYRVVIRHPAGRYGATSGYFTTGAGSTDRVQGPVVRPNQANALAAEQGSFLYNAGIVFPTDYFGGASYFSDVTILVPASGTLTVETSAIASAEAFGTTVASGLLTASPGGIASGEALGTPSLSNVFTASPTSIGSAEAFGTPAVTIPIQASPAGIASGQTFGAPVVSGALAVSTSGITSAEAFGSVTVSAVLTASPGGIATGQAFGTPAVSASLSASPGGITSAEAFGTATISGALTASPGGIATAGAFGTPLVVTSGSVSPAGIPSAEAFGSPAVTGALTASPGGIPTAGAFGVPSALVSSLAAPVGIPSGEAFGAPAVSSALSVSPAGIASAQAVGSPVAALSLQASPVGIASGETFGGPVIFGALIVTLSAIASGEAFGSPAVLAQAIWNDIPELVVGDPAWRSALTVGAPTLTAESLGVGEPYSRPPFLLGEVTS